MKMILKKLIQNKNNYKCVIGIIKGWYVKKINLLLLLNLNLNQENQF